MSHISKISTKIKNPAAEKQKNLLEAAMKKLAEIHGGSLVTSVTDYYKNARPVITGVKTPDLPLGIGITNGANGNIKIIGDKYGNEEQFNKLADQYKALVQTMSAAEAARQQKWRNIRISDKPVKDKDGSWYFEMTGERPTKQAARWG